MSPLKSIHSFISISIVKHILFWVGVFAYFIITAEIKYFTSYEQLLVDKGIIIFIQIIVAYSCIYLLIPKFLIKKKHFLFIIGVLLLFASAYTLFVYIQEYFFRPYYIDNNNLKYDSIAQFNKYIFNFRIFIGKSVKFITPTIIIILARYYKDQQQFSQLKEQKKTSELTILNSN